MTFTTLRVVGALLIVVSTMTTHANNLSPPTPLWWLNSFLNSPQFGQWETENYLLGLGTYFTGMYVHPPAVSHPQQR
jgi:hypothetical protein